MGKKQIRFGIIGCGLMGKEFASAASRWCHLQDLDFEPVIVAVCDTDINAIRWFSNNLDTIKWTSTNYHDLLEQDEIDAIYCAVPHNLHEQIYIDVINAGKHLLGEKPFGIDITANQAILSAVHSHPEQLVRCSSEFPFYPGVYRLLRWVQEGRFGQIIDVEAGFWHSSDLNTDKPINWKRQISTNGAYGCMGDLGMHVLHLPLRLGWRPLNVHSLLSNIVTQRPDSSGNLVSCETWDNAILSCEVKLPDQHFPMILSTKRIAPGHANTWFLRINGMKLSAEFSTKNPKQLAYLPYEKGKEQAWHVIDVPYQSAYPAITGPIFEFGFSDSILQMWAAYCDELVNGENMQQSFRCAAPEEAHESHIVFTAALESYQNKQTIPIN